MEKGSTMTRLTSIVAIDQRGAIGCKNALPWTLKSDMAFFKQQTIGNAVVMGRKTYDSIGKCLPGRENIVLSHNQVLFDQTEEYALASSVDEVLYKISKSKKAEIFVIGGAQTYLEFADLVDRYLVTFVDHAVEGADAFLDPSIRQNFEIWKRDKIQSVRQEAGRDQFSFQIYEITPPNTVERLEKRIERFEHFQSRLPRPKSALRSPKTPFDGSQEVFAF